MGVLSLCELHPFTLGHTDMGSKMGSYFTGEHWLFWAREATKTRTRPILLCEMWGGTSPVPVPQPHVSADTVSQMLSRFPVPTL